MKDYWLILLAVAAIIYILYRRYTVTQISAQNNSISTSGCLPPTKTIASGVCQPLATIPPVIAAPVKTCQPVKVIICRQPVQSVLPSGTHVCIYCGGKTGCTCESAAIAIAGKVPIVGSIAGALAAVIAPIFNQPKQPSVLLAGKPCGATITLTAAQMGDLNDTGTRTYLKAGNTVCGNASVYVVACNIKLNPNDPKGTQNVGAGTPVPLIPFCCLPCRVQQRCLSRICRC